MPPEPDTKTESVTMFSSFAPTALAVGGGLVAQAPDQAIGLTGLVVAVGGLLAGVWQALPKLYEFILKMKEYDLKIAQLQASLADAHERLARCENLKPQVDAHAATLSVIAPGGAR